MREENINTTPSPIEPTLPAAGARGLNSSRTALVLHCADTRHPPTCTFLTFGRHLRQFSVTIGIPLLVLGRTDFQLARINPSFNFTRTLLTIILEPTALLHVFF